MSCFLRLNPNKLPLASKVNQALQKDSAPQSYHLPVPSHNKVTLSLYVFPFQWYFSFLYHSTISLLSHNRILEDIVKELPISQKVSFVAMETTKNHLECTHTQMQTYKSSYQTEVQFFYTKRAPTHRKDSQTYNPLFSKDTRVYV